MPRLKQCGTCQKSKPLADFNRKSARPDGLHEVCRECSRASSRKYYRENGFGTAIILAETAKCDVRCCNCHAMVTYAGMPRTWRSDAMDDVGGSSA